MHIPTKQLESLSALPPALQILPCQLLLKMELKFVNIALIPVQNALVWLSTVLPAKIAFSYLRILLMTLFMNVFLSVLRVA